MARVTVDRTIEERTFTFGARVSGGSPGTYWEPPEPPEPPEVNVETVHEGAVEIEWDAFEELLERLVGKGHAAREIEAIENAALDADADARMSDAEDAARAEAGQ